MLGLIPNLIDDDPYVSPTVMAGRGPATHVFWLTQTRTTWMAGPRPAMTVGSMSRYQRALVSHVLGLACLNCRCLPQAAV